MDRYIRRAMLMPTKRQAAVQFFLYFLLGICTIYLSGQIQYIVMFWPFAAIYGLVWWLKANRDKKLALRGQRYYQPVAPAQPQLYHPDSDDLGM